jgi:hypothetical protein
MRTLLLTFTPRQLLSFKDSVNEENAGAFFRIASHTAPNVSFLIHAIHGVIQNQLHPALGISQIVKYYGFRCWAFYGLPSDDT